MAGRHLELLDLDSSLGTNVMSKSPSQQFVLCGGREVLKIVNIVKDTLQVEKNLRVGKINLNFSIQDLEWHYKEEQYVISAAKNAAVILWNLERKEHNKIQEVYKHHTQIVNRVRWNPLNVSCFVSAGQDGKIVLWDKAQQVPALTMDGRADGARDVQFALGNEHVFASSFDNGTVQMWDVRNPRSCVIRISAHQRNALSIDWHPLIHNYLVSSGSDKQIKVWNVDSAQTPIYKIQAPEPLSRVKWRPGHNNQLCSISHSHDNNLYIWHLGEPYVPQFIYRGHTNLLTDFLWQGDKLITCSQNGFLIRHKVEDACRPMEFARSQTVAVSTSNQVVSFIDNSTDKDPDLVLSKLDKTIIESRLNDRQNRGETASMQLEDPNATIKYFAENYTVKGASIAVICRHNAQVAKTVHREDLCSLWMSVASLIGDQESEVEGDWLQDLLSTTLLDSIEYYAEIGDLQTAAVMCKVLKVEKDRILGDYMELLHSLGLFTPATQLGLKQEDVDLVLRCHCGREMEDSVCSACQTPASCAVCQKPIRGVYTWCQGCSHGGHFQHMNQWFTRNKQCPTGCGHECRPVVC